MGRRQIEVDPEIVGMRPLCDAEQRDRFLAIAKLRECEGEPDHSLVGKVGHGGRGSEFLEDGEGLPPVRIFRIECVAQPAPPRVGVRRPGDGDESSCTRRVLQTPHENPLVDSTQQLARVRPRRDPAPASTGSSASTSTPMSRKASTYSASILA